jgi:hypothetical protein
LLKSNLTQIDPITILSKRIVLNNTNIINKKYFQ